MQTRRLTAEEVKQAEYLWSQAFGRGGISSGEDSDTSPDTSVSFGIYEGDSLQAVANVIDYEVYLGPGVTVKMGGIGGVACLPASRGKGYTNANLLHVLEQMREAGQVTSMLFPFSFDFYRRFGWEWVGSKRKYTVPTQALHTSAETEFVRAATVADWPQLAEVYRAFSVRYRGMLVRSEAKMAERLRDSAKRYTYTYLYEHEGNVEGYLTYSGGSGQETDIGEFLALTPRAQRGLLGLLKRLAMQTEKVTWSAPEDDILWSLRYNWDVKTEIWPVTQARVVDLVGALQAWQPAADARGAVRLAVHDEKAPWNTGVWQIEFAEGKVSVLPTQADAQVSLDIQALSQAYFGSPTVTAIRAAERLVVHDEAGFLALRDLFAGPPMWLNNGF